MEVARHGEPELSFKKGLKEVKFSIKTVEIQAVRRAYLFKEYYIPQ